MGTTLHEPGSDEVWRHIGGRPRRHWPYRGNCSRARGAWASSRWSLSAPWPRSPTSCCARPLRQPRATAPARWPSARASAPAIATPPPPWSRTRPTPPRSSLHRRKIRLSREILRGLAAILELTPRISDLIVSYGERLSSRIVAAAFRELGINAAHVDAREVIITDSNFQKAVPQDALIERAPRRSCARSPTRARCR